LLMVWSPQTATKCGLHPQIVLKANRALHHLAWPCDQVPHSPFVHHDFPPSA
jgi:hypothetical protein